MGQILGKYDHDPPGVRSRCIFAKIYKAKKHPDKRRGLRERERERERERTSNYNNLLGPNPRINA